jgi:hypothetical protein
MFLLGRTLQLKLHVLHEKAFGDRATVIARRRFGARVSRQSDALVFVNLLRDD